MSAIRHILFVVALSLVVSMTPSGRVVRAPAMQASNASAGPVHDTSTDHHGQERRDPLVRLRVRALVPEKVKLSDPTQGTVQATVLAIDEEINQITVHTDEGQRLTLFLHPESLAPLQVGTPCLLQVTNGSTWETPRSPEHDEAFW
jgi:hypothetical protein